MAEGLINRREVVGICAFVCIYAALAAVPFFIPDKLNVGTYLGIAGATSLVLVEGVRFWLRLSNRRMIAVKVSSTIAFALAHYWIHTWVDMAFGHEPNENYFLSFAFALSLSYGLPALTVLFIDKQW